MNITDVLYEMSLNGWCSKDAGSGSETGHWYGRLEGPWSAEDLKDLHLDGVGEDVLEELASCVGAIVSEDSQGFKESQVFQSRKAMDKAWASYETEVIEYNETAEE